MAATDAELVRWSLGGSERAFEELVRRYERPVFAVVVRVVRDPSRAEELAQDTFVKAFRALHTYDQRRKFSSWVLAIAHNTAIDERRRNAMVESRSDHEITRSLKAQGRAAGATNDTPARIAERAELASVIEDAIGRLRSEYRELVNLKYQDDLGYEEIAQITGWPVGTIKSYLHRARKELADELSAAGWGPDANRRVNDPTSD